MKINIKNTLKLFDEKHSEQEGLATPIISMIGEDLGAGCFLQYKKNKIKLVDAKFQARGFKKGSGPRLDRWFADDKSKIIYQCEIKNWCSWATNGVDVRKKGLHATAQRNWTSLVSSEFNRQTKYDRTSKVLMEMKKPEGYGKYIIQPLLILWWPVTLNNKLKPLFKVPIKSLNIKFKTQFKTLNIFSLSLYLNSFKKEIIDIKMPNVNKRYNALKEIILASV